jgi:hypothetical protein
VISLGWVGGLCEIAALLIVLATTRRKAVASVLVAPGE